MPKSFQGPLQNFSSTDDHVPKPLVLWWLSHTELLYPGGCWTLGSQEQPFLLQRALLSGGVSELFNQRNTTYPSRKAMTFFLGLPMFGP